MFGALGWERARGAFWPVLQAAAAAVLAYQIGRHVLGHQQPFFAAIAAWMCLGWSFDRDLRRVGELALGVTMGVALGDLVVRTIGSGWWQLATVLVVSALLARFFDRGPLLTTQAGAQAIVIAGLPNLAGGPYSRALDAVVGSAVALAFVLLTPYDPRKSLRTAAVAGTAALAKTAEQLARGVALGDPQAMAAALDTGRSAKAEMDDGITQASERRARTRLTINRKHLPEIADLEHRLVLEERAMRSLRVLARRLQYDSPAAPAPERLQMAALLHSYASATHQLSQDIAASAPISAPITAYRQLALQLNQAQSGLATSDLGIATGMFLMRAVLADTLQVAGVPEPEVLAILPPRQ